MRHAFYHTVSVERIEAAIDDKGKVTGWRHRTVAPSIVSTFKEDDGYSVPDRIRHGLRQHAVRYSKRALREREGHGAHAHRLVPLGVDDSAHVRGAVRSLRRSPINSVAIRRISCWN